MEATNFAILEQKRRSNDRAGNSSLRRSESAESRSRKSLRGILHIIENGEIAADPGNIAQRAKSQAIQQPAANHLFPAIGHEDAIHDQGQAGAARDSASSAAISLDQITSFYGGISNTGIISGVKDAGLIAGREPQDACKALIDAALAAGGKDNVTVILARYTFPPEFSLSNP